MISSLTTRTPVAISASANQPAPQPTRQPGPAPTDSLDLSSIDTPVKAAVLPILDPGVLGALMAVAAVGGGNGTVNAHLETGTNAANNLSFSNRADLGFTVNTSNQEQPITEGGVIGGRFDYNKVTLDTANKTAHYAGLYDELSLTASPDNSYHIDGHLGSVGTHLVLTQIEKDLPEDTFGFHSQGTLADQAYATDTLIHVDSMDQHNMSLAAHFSTKGTLGQAAITKDYVVNAGMGAQGGQVTITGNGNVAGVPTSLTVVGQTSPGK